MNQILIDQMGRTVEVPMRPLRIISLVPSQTELLVDLIGEERIVGITRFCIHPKGLKSRIKNIGGTKDARLDRIHSLCPDLIIGNKEENDENNIREIAEHYPVWMSDIVSIADALDMIQQVSQLVGAAEKAAEMIQIFLQKRTNLSQHIGSLQHKRVAYFIWKDPFMVAGKDTFIQSWMDELQLMNCVVSSRYPIVQPSDLVEPDLIFLSSEPYPFKDKHIAEMKSFFPNARVMCVDGEYFSWYGTRMLGAPDYFRKLNASIPE